jgi:dolichyl-phosphate beta-glucosyltransferase
MSFMDLSVVIPAYDEEKNIVKAISTISDYFSRRMESWEIIVVNDGSTDKTLEIVTNWIANNKSKDVKLLTIKHSGKGGAVTKGVLSSTGQTTLVTDTDLSTPVADWEKLEKALLNGADIAVGSRQVSGANVQKYQPLFRQGLGLIFGWMVRITFKVGVVDTQCGFKAFDGDIGRNIFKDIVSKGYCFDLEFLVKAKACGHKIKEVPVRWKNDPDSRVNIWKDWPQVLNELISIKREMKNYKKGLGA